LFEGHIQLTKAALTENERVEFEHFVGIAEGSMGRVDAPGNARGSCTGTLRAGMTGGGGRDTIALNDANR
jgi:hypothetical protein